jgi:hypothetical protein
LQQGWPILTNGESEPSWVSDEMGWITSVFALGAVAGSLVSGTTFTHISNQL